MEEGATHVGGAGGHGRRDGRRRAGDAEPLVVLMIRQLSPPLQYMPRVGEGNQVRCNKAGGNNGITGRLFCSILESEVEDHKFAGSISS